MTRVLPPAADLRRDPGRPVGPSTPGEVALYRRRLRRRLLLWSSPVVLVVLLVALKLLSLPVLAGLTQQAYGDREFERAAALTQPLGVLNVVEPWVHHFDRGTAWAQVGVLDVARGEFETALDLAPDDETISCVIRTDLVLTIEAQGDAALLELRYADAEDLFTLGRDTIAEAPKGCFVPPEDPQQPDTSEPLDEADGRLGDKQQEAQEQQQGDGDPGAGDGTDPAPGEGEDGDGGSGSRDPLDQLRDQGEESQQEQQRDQDRERYYEQNPGDYDGKPW